MKRKLWTAALALSLALSLASPALAAPAAVSAEEASQAVSALGIMTGDEAGQLNLSRRVSRAEFVTMAVRAMPGGGQVGQAATSPYPDVPRSHWASGYVEAAVARGLVSGYSDGTFRPAREISLAEGVSMVLQLLGYGPQDFSGAYPTGQMALYYRLRLDRGVSASAPTDPMTRQDAMYLFYNLLSASTKEGSPYLNTLGYNLNSAGQVDLLALVNGEMEGPMVAQGNWQSKLPFTPSKVYRDGAAVSLSSVQEYDVVYWNSTMEALWVTSDKVSGVIQAVEPNTSSPTSVTVAGRSYSIETSAVAYALSDLGQYALGDSVTLLLGRTGGVAAIAQAAAGAGDRIGVVTAVTNGSFPDGKGGTYTAQTVTMMATDGQSYQYEHQGSLMSVGNLVRATVQNGQVVLRGVSSSQLTGKVSADGTKIGELSFAQGARILDVAEGRGVLLAPSRLAELELRGNMVRYYSLNSQGQIDQMVLGGVTGDMYQYGLLLRMDEEGGEGSGYFSYQFLVDGSTYTIPASATRYPVSPRQAVRVVGGVEQPERLLSLTQVDRGELIGGKLVVENRSYALSDTVDVYELRDNQYYLSSLGRLEEGDYSLTAWYDKAESEGGRIRVIVAQAQ